MQQEIEKIQGVKAEMEALLNVELDDDMGKSISDGVLLCQLVNKLYPHTISNIHLPKNSEVSRLLCSEIKSVYPVVSLYQHQSKL
jgi:hypothetical protein